MANPNDQSNPQSAIPSYDGGSLFTNITVSQNTQLKSKSGVLNRLTINTIGTGSAAAFYDGLSSVVTMTIASPGVISWANHPLKAGDAVEFTTTGALPTGFVAGTVYYVSINNLTANSFKLADTKAHALAGTNTINTSGTQSGVHTAWWVTNKIGSYTTTAQNSMAINAQFQNGLIAITSDGGAAADLTVLYR